MSSPTKIDNRKKDILILGKGPTQGLEHTLSAEKCIQLILQKKTKNYVWACIITKKIVTYLLMVKKFHNFKWKDIKVPTNPVCLGNISKNWSVDNMKKTGLKDYVYDFSVDYNADTVSDTLHIHKYLMEKNGIAWKMFKFIKQIFVSTLMFFW